MKRISFLLSVAALIALIIPAGVRGQDLPIGLEQLYRLDLLPAYRQSMKIGAVTSYDRTGGNDDGFSGTYSFVRKEGEDLVLADLKGPGVLYRIHTPTPSESPIEIFFDGEEKPRVSMPFRELFTGGEAPFVKPICGVGAGGFYCYVPMPYQKSCKILLRQKHFQFYDLNYATFADDVRIETFDPKRAAADTQSLEKIKAALVTRPETDLTAFNVPSGAKIERVSFDQQLEPGKSTTVFQTDRGGRIAGLRIGPASAFASKDRDIFLRITWDDEKQPAVLCPVGDFFGYAWGQPAAGGALIGTRGDWNYCNLPMPFDRAAKIEFVSLRDSGPAVAIRGEVILADAPRQQHEGKLYAVWRRENPTTEGKPFTFVETKGRGHVVGFIIQAQGMTPGDTSFFEGDDQTTIDGELVIHGTGSEDFFNGGWYEVPDRWDGPVSLPLSGCLAYQKPIGRTGAYRFMITDVYPFHKSILQTIEHAPERNAQKTDYVGLTFVYCEQPPTVEYAIPDLAARRVVDPEKAVFNAAWNVPVKAFCFNDATLRKRNIRVGEANVRALSLRPRGPDPFGPPFISITCDLPSAGRYEITIEALKTPESGQVQLFQDETPVGEPIDLYAQTPEKTGPIKMGAIQANGGPHHLMFKIVGKNEASRTLGFDLMNIICEKE